jgi:hypothetical protein
MSGLDGISCTFNKMSGLSEEKLLHANLKNVTKDMQIVIIDVVDTLHWPRAMFSSLILLSIWKCVVA